MAYTIYQENTDGKTTALGHLMLHKDTGKMERKLWRNNMERLDILK